LRLTIKLKDAIFKKEVLDGRSYAIYVQVNDLSINNAYNPRAFYLRYTRTPLAFEDLTIDSSKTVDYFVDLNGKVITQPKGLVIAIYNDGTRSKVVYE
jgi:hypothetical protein